MKLPVLRNVWALALTALLALVGLCAPAFAGTPNLLLVMPIRVAVVTDPPATAPTVTGNFTYDVNCVRRQTTPPTFSSPAATLTQIQSLLNVGATVRVYDSGTCTVTQTSRPAAPTGYSWSSTPPQVSPATYAGFPSAGFAFADVVAPPTTITNTLVPNSIPITTTVSPVTLPASGTLSCNPNPGLTGTTSLCTAVAATGYSLVSVNGCGGNSTTSLMATATLSVPCQVTATFALNTYAVTVVASPTIAGTVSCATPINHGATSLCSVTSTTPGYTFSGWTTSGCGAASSTATYTTNALTAACTVTAAFTLNSYAVTAAANPTIGGVVSCASPVNHGATSACSVTSTTSGYTFAGWTTSGCGAASSAATYTTNALTAACTVTAAFALNAYTVTGIANPALGGTVSCASPVNFNASSTCTAAANTGYTLTSISGCGGTASATSPYTTGAVTANCTVTGNFVLNTYAITTVAIPAAGGTLACAPNPVTHGATASCTATPNAGYLIAPITGTAVAGAESAKALGGGISGCGGAPTAISPFTTAAVTAPCTVIVNFVLNTFPVATNVVVVGGGTLNCTAASVAFGATTTCTASANAGFTLTGISGCGGVPSTTSSFTTGAVTAACTVTARFVAAAAAEPAVQVPALDPWLIALMALLTALCGARVLAARRRSARGETH